MSPPGYLLVYGDPGTTLSEDEFHGWYDNEHVPLRVAIPAFTSWARWKAADGAKPGWAASYDLTSYDELDKPPYATLAETRSEREKRVCHQLGAARIDLDFILQSELTEPREGGRECLDIAVQHGEVPNVHRKRF